MKLSTYALAIVGLTTSVLASPVPLKRSSDLQTRAPIGQFIWQWYGEKEADASEESDIAKRSADLEARAPIGQFIWQWYGEKDAEDIEASEAAAEAE
ncbi:hypothetical protein OHC33_000999 [Knufia fluminis]|uniref:Uncharacterized protein n=1 Tax=Knufia fluminis TaxID=191047 RepID=A0AAN8EWN4_9EURO|nr:hypothetical protein OHC33_000999 [Knufia fluminis]